MRKRKQSRRLPAGCISSLSDDLLLEIFYKLPGQHVIRCNSVCKRWLSVLLSIPNFVHRSIHTNHPSHNCVKFYFQYRFGFAETRKIQSNCSSFPYDFVDHQLLKLILPSYREKNPGRVRLVAHFNDLVVSCQMSLVHCSGSFIYHICNPLTKQWFKLPKVPSRYQQCSLARICFLYYPYYCNQEDHVCTTNARYTYKLVCIPIFSEPTRHFPVEIYCSQSGKWSQSGVLSPGINTLLCNQPFGNFTNDVVAYKGIVFWVNDRGKQIVAYDPLADVGSCRFLYLPTYVRNDVTGADCIGVCNGKLRVSQVIGVPECGFRLVWELDDCNLDKWVLVQKVSIHSDDGPFRYMKVVAFHPLDGDIIFIVREEQLISYNMRTKRLQVAYNLGKGYLPMEHVEKFYPIVHQWWPTPIPPLL